MKKRLLYITSANLATNPRLVKEIDTLSTEYELDVVLFRVIHWSSEIDETMRSARPHIRFMLLDVSKRNIIQWGYWAVVEKMSRLLLPLLKNQLSIVAGALSRKSIILSHKLKLNQHYSLIIAHTLPALYPAYRCSNRWHIPFGFDIEDYDSGMTFANAGKDYKNICQKLYQNILPKAAYLTSSSPLIGNYTLKLINGHPKHRVILNSFPKKEFNHSTDCNHPIDTSPTIKFVWFSMTISYQRGLEQFFEAINLIHTQHKQPSYSIELTLIGNLDGEFELQVIKPFIENRNAPKWFRVKIIKALPQLELHELISSFDIGLAMEFSSSDLNRQLCLTNKILAYTQAGLYVLATNTPAQQQYMEEHPTSGIIAGQTSNEIASAIIDISKRITEIRSDFNTRLKVAENISWEKQENTLRSLINNAITA